MIKFLDLRNLYFLAKDLRTEVIKWRAEGSDCLSKHLSEVNIRMTERDISEKKNPEKFYCS